MPDNVPHLALLMDESMVKINALRVGRAFNYVAWRWSNLLRGTDGCPGTKTNILGIKEVSPQRFGSEVSGIFHVSTIRPKDLFRRR